MWDLGTGHNFLLKILYNLIKFIGLNLKLSNHFIMQLRLEYRSLQIALIDLH